MLYPLSYEGADPANDTANNPSWRRVLPGRPWPGVRRGECPLDIR